MDPNDRIVHIPASVKVAYSIWMFDHHNHLHKSDVQFHNYYFDVDHKCDLQVTVHHNPDIATR